MKECRLCHRVLPLDQFHRATGARDGHRGECKDCFRARARERYPQVREQAIERARRWREENIDRFREGQRRRRSTPEGKAKQRAEYLKRKFGLTPEQYEAMLAAQGGVCALCGAAPTEGISLHVDHDHRTGQIRKLLCFRCNNALGDLDDDPARLRQAAAYVEAHDPEVQAEVERARRRAGDLVGSTPR